MFTYVGMESTYITKIFQNTNVMIAYLTHNSIQENLVSKTHIPRKFSANGVYKLTCPDCGKQA
jgi:hypothetical protein